jgi:predicted pyridoxine 5'-phosphate oxidase superfamily flavin-nucleotide-binding protein
MTVRDEITPALEEFIGAQKMFVVATAPSGADGHVNLSPKGLDTFTVVGPREVAYLDLTGSGAETIAHLVDNGRVTLMFCAFDGDPKILRLYGRGEAAPAGSPRARELLSRFPEHLGARAVIRVQVERVATSCGFGVPLMDFKGERPDLADWSTRKGPGGLTTYRDERNAVSIDGLPAWSALRE